MASISAVRPARSFSQCIRKLHIAIGPVHSAASCEAGQRPGLDSTRISVCPLAPMLWPFLGFEDVVQGPADFCGGFMDDQLLAEAAVLLGPSLGLMVRRLIPHGASSGKRS